MTPLRLLLERPRGAPVDFCERPLKPITKFETSVIDVIRCVRDVTKKVGRDTIEQS